MTNITSIICWIYKSPKKQEMYLYNDKKDDFSDIPENLLSLFGSPQFVMELQLTPEKKLARVDIEQVIENLMKEGFYLQMPPNLKPDLYYGNDV